MFDELLESIKRADKLKECVCHVYGLSDRDLLEFYGSMGDGWKAYNELYGSDKAEVEKEITKRGLDVNEDGKKFGVDVPPFNFFSGTSDKIDGMRESVKEFFDYKRDGSDDESLIARAVSRFGFSKLTKTLCEGLVEKKGEEVIEKLAALEHEQWMQWAKDILKTEDINKERTERWEKLFVPYDKLDEEMKELDREWARKALAITKE